MATVTVGPSTIPLAAQTAFSIDATEVSQPYEAFAIFTSNPGEIPDPFLDCPGFLNYAATHPVPQSWGLGFEGMSGELLDANGQSAATKVSVPNDPSLIGNAFYFVVATELPIAGEPTAMISNAPFLVEIQ